MSSNIYQGIVGLSLIAVILIFYNTETSKFVKQDNLNGVYNVAFGENRNISIAKEEQRALLVQQDSTAEIVNAQRFYGTLLILAGSPKDFVYPYTKRYDNSTGKWDLIHRRFYFGYKGYDKKLRTDKLMDECPHDCQFTIDTSRFAEADVILMHTPGDIANQKNAYVRRARPEQMFTYFYYEQPHHYSTNGLRLLNNKIGFNWTLHYQQDATFFMPYGWTKRRPTPLVSDKKNHAANRTRKVVWVVSRCDTAAYQKREHYVAELIKHIDIDVFGLCAGKSKGIKEKLNFATLLKNYKFVISFENADCDDYISEKFFRNIQVGVVPIVMGRRAHYGVLAPPYSYIQADSFDSPKHLAAYLHLLDKNDELYNKYFEWNANFITESEPTPLCEVCRQMREIYYKPSQIDMMQYLGIRQRCWLYPSTQLQNWREKVENVSFPNPWTTIHQLNSRDSKLRFP